MKNKTKTEYIYEIHTIDTGKTYVNSKNDDKSGDRCLKSFSSHIEAQKYVNSLKKGSAYDLHYLKVSSKFCHAIVHKKTLFRKAIGLFQKIYNYIKPKQK